MTSFNPTSPKVQDSGDDSRKGNYRPDSPLSCYESSPERVTWQNQLLQPVLLPSRTSTAPSELNIAKKQETSSLEVCSKSDNAFEQVEEMSLKMVPLKETNNKRTNWFKIIRLQLNALHEKKFTNADADKPAEWTRTSERDASNACKGSQLSPVWMDQTQTSTSSGSLSQPIKGSPASSLVTSDTMTSTTNEFISKPILLGENRKKRTTNMRGRISHFWRQAAAAALKHQKQKLEEDTANDMMYSTSSSSNALHSEEQTAQRFLMTVFQNSWPSLQQVTCWQHSFQNLLQDPDGLAVFQGFLQGEFSDENLEFWVACQKYKSLTDKSLQRLRAQEIFDDFMAFQSQREVNLDCETRIQTEKRVSLAEADLFDASQKRIEALMEKDPYRRFLRSTLYLKLVDVCQGHQESCSTDNFNDNDAVESHFALPVPITSATAHSSPQAPTYRPKSRPSHSVDLGNLRIISLKATKS